MNELAPIEPDAIWRPSAALNPQRLDYLYGLAEKIAAGTTVPESLRGERKGQNFEAFDHATVVANVFAVVEQADRWNVSPFALIAAAAIVRGKLVFEGKVVAAVLEAQFGVKLYPYYRGKPGTDSLHVYLCDVELPDDILAQLEPGYRHDRYRIMDGSVGKWKTTGNGSPWRPDTYADMLIYRGVRQWCRVYKSAAILGVLADDEIDVPALEYAAQNAVPIGQRFAAAGAAGFSPDNVTKALEDNSQQPMEIIDQETGEVTEVRNTEAQSARSASLTTSGRKDTGIATGSPASEKPSSSPGPSADGDDGRAGSAASSGTQPQNSSPPPAGDDAGGGDSASSFVPVSAATFREIGQTLLRFGSEESVKKGYVTLLRQHNMTRATLSQRDADMATAILDAHYSRIRGEASIDLCKQAIEAAIAEHFGEKL